LTEKLSFHQAVLPNSVIRGTFEPQADPRLEVFDGLVTCINPGGRKSEIDNGLVNKIHI